MYIFFFDFAIQCLIGRWFTSCLLMLSSSFMSMLTHLSFWIKWSLCCLQSRAVTHWSGWIKWSSCCLQPRTMMGIWKHVIIILMILFHGFWAKDMGYLCGAIWEQLGEHMGTKLKKCSPPPPKTLCFFNHLPRLLSRNTWQLRSQQLWASGGLIKRGAWWVYKEKQ